jgi:hypothetical protein
MEERHGAPALSFCFRREPGLCNPLKGPGLSAQKKSAIVKAERNPAVVPELDDLRYLTLQGLLGFPSEGFGDQPDPIANLETGVWLRFSVHLLFALNPISTRRRIATGLEGLGFGCSLIQASTDASSDGGSRNPIWGAPLPSLPSYSAGLPRFFLLLPVIVGHD